MRTAQRNIRGLVRDRSRRSGATVEAVRGGDESRAAAGWVDAVNVSLKLRRLTVTAWQVLDVESIRSGPIGCPSEANPRIHATAGCRVAGNVQAEIRRYAPNRRIC